MLRWPIAFSVILLLLPFNANSKAAGVAEFYVSPQGNDKNAGAKDRPFASLQRARDAVRELKRVNGLPKSGAQIRLHGGQYVMQETLLLTPQDSGTPESPVSYEAMPGEKPVITGQRAIAGWKKLDADAPGVTAQAKGHVWSADIPKGWRFHYLYVNGVPQPVARQPKTDDIWSWLDDVEIGPADPAGMRAIFPKGKLANLPSNGDVEMVLITTSYWNSIPVLKGIDSAACTARIHSKMPLCGPLGYKHYCLRNALALLDQPSEWCVDSAAGKVYYWPIDGTIDGKDVLAPQLCELVRLQGAEGSGPKVAYVRFRGLTFTYADRLPEDRWPDDWLMRNSENPDAAVFLRNVEDCAIEDCTMQYLGAYAIALDRHAQRVRIVGNEMGWLGSGGINVTGYGPGTTDVNKGHLISRNNIHHTGQAPYFHGAAVTLYQSGSNEISYNLIHHLPYAGIVIVGAPEGPAWRGNTSEGTNAYGPTRRLYGMRTEELPASPPSRAEHRKYLHSRNNTVKRNVLSDYMLMMADGGAIYTWYSGTGNQWVENILLRAMPSARLLMTLYLDDGVDGSTVKDNLVWAAGETIDKGQNLWANNTASYPAKPAGLDARIATLIEAVKQQGGWRGDWLPYAMPIMIQGNPRFARSTMVSLDCVGAGAPMHYTTDGSAPTRSSAVFSKPLALDRSAIVKASIFDADGQVLRQADAAFAKVQPRPYRLGQWITTADLLERNGTILQGSQIHSCDDGKWVLFGPFEFGQQSLSRAEFEIAVHPEQSGDGRAIEIRLDDADGPIVGTLAPTATGDWDKFKVQSTALKDVTGTHAVVIRFRGHAVCNLAKFRFLK